LPAAAGKKSIPRLNIYPMNEFERAKGLFIEGLQSLEANNCQAAENQFAQSLTLVPDRVSTLNNLAAVKIRLEKFAEAEALARRAAVLDEKSQEAWTSLGFALTQLTRHAEALAACDRALKLNPRRHEALYAKSLALKELNRPEEAKTNYLQSLETRMAAAPLFSAPRLATQKAEVLIVNGNPVVDLSLKTFENLHVGQNFPGQIVQRLHEDFHFTYAFRDDVVRCQADGQIPPPDLIINNDTNAEALAALSNHAELCDLIDRIGAGGQPSGQNHADRPGRDRQIAGSDSRHSDAPDGTLFDGGNQPGRPGAGN
jgi:tetratricopeptide (TPR) repeat protein